MGMPPYKLRGIYVVSNQSRSATLLPTIDDGSMGSAALRICGGFMSLARFFVWMFSLMLGVGIACAQTYPDRPVRIVTSGVGGGNDFVARLVAQGFTNSLGQQVIVENRGSG